MMLIRLLAQVLKVLNPLIFVDYTKVGGDVSIRDAAGRIMYYILQVKAPVLAIFQSNVNSGVRIMLIL